MPKKLHAQSHHADAVQDYLGQRPGLEHLRVRRRADLITLESGPSSTPIKHARLRRVGVHVWQLEMATHTGRWEPTPIRGQQRELLDALVNTFGWTLQPIAG